MYTQLTIAGTHCASCKALIEDVASETAGIRSCTVDYANGSTRIEHDENVDWDAFAKEIASLGPYTFERPK